MTFNDINYTMRKDLPQFDVKEVDFLEDELSFASMADSSADHTGLTFW